MYLYNNSEHVFTVLCYIFRFIETNYSDADIKQVCTGRYGYGWPENFNIMQVIDYS